MTRRWKIREAIRRLALAGGVMLAAALALWPVETIWAVRRATGPAESQRLPVVTVQGEAWEQLFQAELAGTGTCYAPDHPVLRATGASLSDQRPALLARLDDSRALVLSRHRSGHAIRYAPATIAYPWRRYALWPAVGGVLVYLLLPRPPRGDDELRYRQATSAILPDFMGTVLATLFGALPLFVIPAASSPLEPWRLLDFEAGWAWLTIVAWLLAHVGFAILFAALWYATLRIQLRPDRIRKCWLFGEAEVRLADVVAVEPVRWQLPAGWRTVAFVVGLFDWRLLGPSLIGMTQQARGIHLRTREGGGMTLWLDHLEHAERLHSILSALPLPSPSTRAAERV